MDETATEQFYGIMRSISGIGIVCSTLIAGYVCNTLQNTRFFFISLKK